MQGYFDAIEGNRGCAAEILTSAYCNMDCEYCYIPKNDQMKEMHKEVVEHLKNPDTYIEKLHNLYGDNLEHLSFWGTEPTLVLQFISPNIGKFLRAFPRLREFGFSTNFLSHASSVPAFIDAVDAAMKVIYAESDTDKETRFKDHHGPKIIKISTQISIDGPASITDVSRKAGATASIVKNFGVYLDYLAETALENVWVDVKFKPTIGIEHLRDMALDVNKMDEYFQFFNDLHQEYVDRKAKIGKKAQLRIAGSGTLMVPGKYTSEDGKTFALYLQRQKEFGRIIRSSKKYSQYIDIPSEYLHRFESFMMVHEESLRTNATCSGGDTNFAYDTDNQLHICHRSFYMNDKRYIEAIARDNDTDNWDVSLFESGKISNLQKNYIVDASDEDERTRFLTVMRGFHDYRELRESYVYTTIKWLSMVGQANPRFLKDDEFARLFSKYIVFVFGCSIENILNTTSIHFTPISILRIFGNGVFEIILNEYMEKRPRNDKQEELK